MRTELQTSQLTSCNHPPIKNNKEDNLYERSFFQWLQLTFKFTIKEIDENATNLIVHDHHLIKGLRVITLDKLTSTKIYSVSISKVQNKPSSNIYFKNPYNDYNTDWTAIYIMPRFVTYNTYMWSFQYEILNNVVFLNKKFHTFRIKSYPLFSSCNLYDDLFTYFMNVIVWNVYGRT